ncbi:hypothetical protein HH214_15870 [Mucilaginibacter robiniae]|uniref:Uncharacterized protein n=1 Tax=Mucilaginibacter robiniae TaxID=2728022 RepID=A0A7L5E1H4_9SPHI|nr:hypothetical protein [Mucilaginibacter robiniae]QJD97240.1 hypothetical protein HH214_15870 [Mucilaginibacter robiniae]
MDFTGNEAQHFTLTLLILGIVYVGVCFAIAWVWGRKRKVGFLLSLVFSLMLTPLIGVVLTLSSKATNKNIV